jgi:hypothetical protein
MVGVNALSQILAGFPIGLAGGAGYGFGIRYGFENLKSSFDNQGVGGAVNSLSRDLGTLLQEIFSAAQSGIKGLEDFFVGDDSDTQGVNIPNVPSDQPSIDDIRNATNNPIPGTLDNHVTQQQDPIIPNTNNQQVRLEVNYQERGDPNLRTFTVAWTRTEQQHIDAIAALEELATRQQNVNDSNAQAFARQNLSKLTGYRLAFKEHFGYWV